MHRRASLVIATAAVLAVAAPAGAKQVTGASVCGANGCVDRSHLLSPSRDDGGLLDLGVNRTGAPAPAPFIRLKIHVGAGSETFGTNTLIVLPKQGIAAAEDGTWWKLSPHNVAEVRRLARGIAPLPASRLPGVELPTPADEGSAGHAQVNEVYQPAQLAPAATRHSGADAADGGLSPIVPAGIAALLLGAGGAILVTRRRRHATDALGETPATT
jgi:hypothetical protein